MSFDTDIAEQIQRLRIETTGWETSIADILAEPRYERIWEWWKLLAAKQEDNHFERLEDAPEGINVITVMGPDLMTQYRWEQGRYIKSSDMTKEACKDIYGEE